MLLLIMKSNNIMGHFSGSLLGNIRKAPGRSWASDASERGRSGHAEDADVGHLLSVLHLGGPRPRPISQPVIYERR